MNAAAGCVPRECPGGGVAAELTFVLQSADIAGSLADRRVQYSCSIGDKEKEWRVM